MIYEMNKIEFIFKNSLKKKYKSLEYGSLTKSQPLKQLEQLQKCYGVRPYRFQIRQLFAEIILYWLPY